MLQRALMILWPAFLTAGMAEACFFALFDPIETLVPAHGVTFSPMAIYTIGFFFFWAMCALASSLTYYLLKVPETPDPPF